MKQNLKSFAAQFFFLIALFPVAAQAQMLVVALSGDNQALLIDPTNYKTLATLPVGVNPHDLAISTDGRFAYLAIMGTEQEPGHFVTVLDLKQRTVKATFDTAPYIRCHDLRVSRNGALLWLTCAPSKAVLEMDARNGTIRRTWKLDQDGAWMIGVTPDEHKLYTANLEGKSVSIIDRRANRVRNLAFASSQIGMDIAPNGRTLWVHHMEQSTLSVIDVATDKVIATLPSAGRGFGRVKLTPDGKLVLVPQSESKNVALFDAASRQLLASIPLSASPKVITISADSRRAFITSPATNQMLVIDIAARKEIVTIPTGKAPDGIGWVENGNLRSSSVPHHNEHPAWSPDGRKIAFASNRDGNNEIYMMNADGSNQQRLTHAPGRDAHPAWSPDGKKIAFQSPRDGDGSNTNLYVMNPDGSNQVKITNLKGFAGVPCWSPDGKQIVFQWEDESRAEKRWHIYVVNGDGSNLRQLTNDAANNQVPNWSRDGKGILFFSDVTGKNQLYLMNADGSNKQRLTDNSANDHAAFWSRDGKRIVFISDRDGSREIYTMNADGTNQTRVTKGVTAFQANWSADGKRILFADVKNGNAQLYTINADGSGLRPLTK